MPFKNVISFTMGEVKGSDQRGCDLISPECVVLFPRRVNTNPASIVAKAVRQYRRCRGTSVVNRASGLWVKWDAKEDMPESFNKIPEVTLAFWIIKIAATT